MSYSSIVEMAQSNTLRERMTACAAQEGIDQPAYFIDLNIWRLSATSAWGASWDSAKASYNVNQNPDFGARTDIISDADILTAVQAIAPVEPLLAEDPPTE